MLEKAARALNPVLQDIVFVGGSIVGLLLTDETAPMPRSTEDVDVIVQVSTRFDYYAVEENIASLGFERNTKDGVICR